MTSGASRSAYLPDVPCFAEQGRPDLVVKEWFAFFAAGPVAPATVQATSLALQEVLARPEVADVFATAGMTVASSSPQALVARVAAERAHWQRVIRAQGIQAD